MAPVIFWWDNFDRNLESLSGKSYFRNTPGIKWTVIIGYNYCTYSTKPELRLCTDSNPSRIVSEIYDNDENF